MARCHQGNESIKFYHSEWIIGSKGWRSGESTRLPPMWLRFSPGVAAICGLSLLLVLSSSPRAFPPGTLVFPLTLKANTFIYQFDLGRADTFKTSSWCAAKRFWREVSSSSRYSIKMVHLLFCLNSLISRYHPFTSIRKLCCFNFVYFPRQVSNLVSRLSRLFRLGVVRACVLVTSLLWWRWKWF